MRALRVLLLTGLVALVLPVGPAAADGTVMLRSPWKGAWQRPAPTAVVVPAPAGQAVPTTAPTDLAAFAVEVARLVNRERSARGLVPLRASTCATGYATRWSQQMATTGAFEHQSLSAVMTGCRARGAGENIAYGARTPADLMSMWMGSSGHRANILRGSFTHLGVGLARSAGGRLYATQVFLTL